MLSPRTWRVVVIRVKRVRLLVDVAILLLLLLLLVVVVVVVLLLLTVVVMGTLSILFEYLLCCQ